MKKTLHLKNPSLAVLALALAGVGLAPNVSAQIVTNVVSDTTFSDDSLPWEPPGQPRWPWTYCYQWGYSPDPSINPVSDTHYYYPENSPTNIGQRVVFDTSVFKPVPPDAGYGVGFGAGMNWNTYDPAVIVWPTNRQDYLISFDARVEGLLPGVTTVSTEMQSQFDAPDDTIQPPDANTDADRVFQINMMVPLGTNWAHFEYTLDKGTFSGGTSEEMLVQYASFINSVNYNVNFHMPSDQFGFDADNVVFLDNVKLSVITRPPPTPPAPKTPFTISDWNFDDRGVWYSYGYEWSQNTNHMVVTASHNAAGFGVGGSNAWTLHFDNTSFLNAQPGWAGGGIGTGGPFDGTYLDTTNLSLYRVAFDARVEGLAETRTSTPGHMHFRLRVPDDTIQPPDLDPYDDVYFTSSYDMTLRSNWQTFSFTLDKGSYSASDYTNFVRLYRQTSSLEPEFTIDNAAGDFAVDADNTVIIDNLRFGRLVEGLPPLTITPTGGTGATLNWGTWLGVGHAQLQSATSATGTFTDVTNATNSPANIQVTTAPQFYRLKWVPPAP